MNSTLLLAQSLEVAIFGLFYLLIVVWLYQLRRRLDPTNGQAPPVLRMPLDPYEIGYLASQDDQMMIAIAVFRLIRHGYLEIRGRKISQVTIPPDPGRLSAYEQHIFAQFIQPAKLRSKVKAVTEATKAFSQQFKQWGVAEQLFVTPQMRLRFILLPITTTRAAKPMSKRAHALMGGASNGVAGPMGSSMLAIHRAVRSR